MWVKEKKREIYDDVIEFKDRRKNIYHLDYEDYLDGLLEQPKPHENNSIRAEFPGMDFDAYNADGTARYQ